MCIAAAAAIGGPWGNSREPTQLSHGQYSRPVPDDPKVHANEVCRHSSSTTAARSSITCAALIGVDLGRRRRVGPPRHHAPYRKVGGTQGLPELPQMHELDLRHPWPHQGTGPGTAKMSGAGRMRRAEVARTSKRSPVSMKIVISMTIGGYASGSAAVSITGGSCTQ